MQPFPPKKKSCNLFTKKSRNHSTHKKNYATSPQKIAQPPQKKIMQPEWVREWVRKIMQSCNLPLHTQNHASSQQNIATITKHCPENITSVVKCVELLFPKVLRLFLLLNSIDSSDSSENVHATYPQKISCNLFFFLLSQHFWKIQINTFDNWCDVLRAAFCDSFDVLSRWTNRPIYQTTDRQLDFESCSGQLKTENCPLLVER